MTTFQNDHVRSSTRVFVNFLIAFNLPSNCKANLPFVPTTNHTINKATTHDSTKTNSAVDCRSVGLALTAKCLATELWSQQISSE